MNRGIAEILIFSIPEAIVIFLLASALIGRKFTRLRLVIMSITFGGLAYLSSSIIGNFLFNILFSSFLIVTLLEVFGNYELFEAISLGLMAISIYLAIEFVNIKTLQILTGIDPTQIQGNLGMRIQWFLPQIIATIGLSIMIRHIVNRYEE